MLTLFMALSSKVVFDLDASSIFGIPERMVRWNVQLVVKLVRFVRIE